jgi:ABC-type transport system involved in multi-copper enzyme maturation permease subunit
MSSVLKKIAIIARFTLLEALRTRLPWVALAMAGLLYLGSLFVQHIAIAESVRMQTGFLAATLRLAMVFMLSLHVAGSMVREFNDKGVELLLALDLPRAGYYLGRFLGFAAIATSLAVVAGAVVLSVVQSTAVAWWTASLAFELILVAALALFCVVTFVQIMPAISFVMAFYLLARGISAVRLLSVSPLLAPDAWTNRTIAWLVDALAWLLPDLGRFTLSNWLVDQPPSASSLGLLAMQALIYSALLVCAGLYDLYRKSL